jgi:hypothetical protein
MLEFEYHRDTIGCCCFCQASVGGASPECITHGFDVICMDCARKIASLLPSSDKPHVCSKCGEAFGSKGELLAHYRAHKREESANDG